MLKLCKRLLKTQVVSNFNNLKYCNIAVGSSESEIIEKWKRKFKNENVSEIDTSIRHILNQVIGEERRRDGKISMSEAEFNRFEQLCECRIAKMPIQYIVGKWDFCDLVLKMVPPVFIPRPETEELVELILQQNDEKLTMRFLEIGCGTGAISLALLHSLPKAQCIAIDQSDYACKLTLENAKMLGLQNRIRILKHKLTDESELREIEGKLDLIISNPPYVPTSVIKTLAPEITLYEDLRALDGGKDGLDVIKSVLKLSAQKLCLQGHLWLEVDPKHPSQIQEYLEHHSTLNLQFVASYRDMFHKDRFVEIKKV